MCLILPSRVVALHRERVEVELADGGRALASGALKPDLAVGEYVLVDRGIVVETISAEDAHAILDMYREIAEMLEGEPA